MQSSAMARTYSTGELAEKVGIARRTLASWLAAGKIREPRGRVMIGGMTSRVWTERDLERLKEYKARYYWKKSRGAK